MWAKQTGVHYRTAYGWWRKGLLPVPAYQTPSGSIMVDVPMDPAVENRSVVYARVSSHDQSESLNAQVARVSMWATQNGHRVDEIVTEVGSGLNGKRPKFKRLLADQKVTPIIVEHRDRYCRFGAEYIEAALSAQGRRVVIVDETEVDDDLVRDVTEVLTSLCARLYGKRSAKARAAKGLKAVQSSAAGDEGTGDG